MDETDGGTNRIDNVNRAAIRYINSQTDSALVSNDAVAVCETLVRGERNVDDRNLVPVNLLSRDERHRGYPLFSADRSMNVVQSRQRLRFVVRHLNAGHHAQGESVDDPRYCTQRREPFRRKLSVAHFGEIVRVRVVVVVGMGGRLPA